MSDPSQAPALAVPVIPAYRPDEKLVALCRTLSDAFAHFVVIDDGSGSDYAALFSAVAALPACTLVTLPHNGGKGAALRAGFAAVAARWPDADIVTADADGQHTPADIVRVATTLRAHPQALTLGVRTFPKSAPLRSRFGNFWARLTFRLLTGCAVSDTQTGLRGIPAACRARACAVTGDRYDFELRLLADAVRWPERPVEVPIETVYIEDNRTSHFRPVRDAVATQWALVCECCRARFRVTRDGSASRRTNA